MNNFDGVKGKRRETDTVLKERKSKTDDLTNKRGNEKR